MTSRIVSFKKLIYLHGVETREEIKNLFDALSKMKGLSSTPGERCSFLFYSCRKCNEQKVRGEILSRH